MGKTRGWFLALFGLAILAGSLVLSVPDRGHGESAKAPGAPSASPASRAKRAPDPEAAAAASGQSHPSRSRPVLPIQEAGLFRFQTDDADATILFPVPGGKRLVIEHVSVRLQLQEGRRATGLLTAQTGGGYATHVLPLASFGKFPEKGEVFGVSQPLRAYADGGTSLQIRVERTAASDADSGFVSISGFLEECP